MVQLSDAQLCDWCWTYGAKATCPDCGRRVSAAAGAVCLANGGAVKSVSPFKVRALGVCWGGSDLVGDTFVRGVTDLGPMAKHGFKGLPIFYSHAQGGIKSQIGVVTYADENDEGITFDMELDRVNSYLAEIQKMITARKLGSSTGAVGHTVVRKAGKLLRWHIGELSLVPDPAEFRTFGRVAPI